MIRLLAVSDRPSKYLELCLEKKNARIEADIVCSCGDIPDDYLDMLKIFVTDDLVMVMGNEDKKSAAMSIMGPASMSNEDIMEALRKPAGKVIHARTKAIKGYLFCGFSGIRSNQERPFHFTEANMRRFVRRVKWQVWMRRWLDRLLFQPIKPVIVISHVPPVLGDPACMPSGFVCFTRFIEQIKPMIWIHGHAPLSAYHHIEKQNYAGTTIINAFEYKRIVIDGNWVEIGYKLEM